MTKLEYLTNLGWDTTLYTVKSKEECEPVKNASGHMNNMYAIKDLNGKKAFGEGAMVVNIPWYERSKPAQAAQPVAPTPPPPPVAPKPVEKQEAPAKKERPGYVGSRIANLENAGSINKSDLELVELPDGKTISYDKIEDMENGEWGLLLASLNPNKDKLEEELRQKEEQARKSAEEAEAKRIAEAEAAEEKRRKEAEAAAAKAERELEAKQQRAARRIEFLRERGLEVNDKEKTVVDDEGTEFSFDDFQKLNDQEWQAITLRYTPLNIRKRREARQAEAKELEEAQAAVKKDIEKKAIEDGPRAATDDTEEKVVDQLIEENVEQKDKEMFHVEQSVGNQEVSVSEKQEEKPAASLKEQTKFRRQALRAIGFEDDLKEEVLTGPAGVSLTYKEVLDIPEARFKEILNQDKPAPKEQPKKQEKPAQKQPEVVAQPVTSTEERDQMAFDFVMKMLSPDTTWEAEKLAKYAYDLADAMLRLKK